MRNRLFSACLALVAGMSASATLADPLSLSDISDYLSGINEVQGDFTQVNSDGSISSGSVAIRRPGRIRFDYDPPNGALVMASGGAIYVVDRQMGGTHETYPLRETPLWMLLRPSVNLAGTGSIVAQSYADGMTSVTARDPEHPERGTLQMSFSDEPVALRQWVVTDQTGAQTTVTLQSLEPAELRNDMFRPAQ